MLRRHGGFTLVELLLTVSLVITLSTMATASLLPWVREQRLTQTTTLLASTIREAQVRAIREGRSWRVLLDPSGTRYFLQYYTASGTAPQDCSATGWVTTQTEELPEGQTIDYATATRYCIGFDLTGRAAWTQPHVVVAPKEWDTSEYWSTVPTWRENLDALTDDLQFEPGGCDSIPTVLPNATRDTGLVVWYNKIPSILIDLGEVPYLTELKLGFFTRPVSWTYPGQVTVKASSDEDPATNLPATEPDTWTTVLYSGTGPTDPPTCNGNRYDVAWLTVPVNGRHRFINVGLRQPTINRYLSMHQIVVQADLIWHITGPNVSKDLVVAATTGKVSFQ